MTTADAVARGRGGRRNAITGILVEMIDGAIAARAAKELKIKLDGDESPEQVSVLLHQRFQDDVVKGAKFFKCNECGGGSTDAVDTCPYCGEGGEAPPVGTNPLSAETAPEGPSEETHDAGLPPEGDVEDADIPVDLGEEDPLGGTGEPGPGSILVETPEQETKDDPHAIDARVIEAAAPEAMADPAAKPPRAKKQRVAPPPPLPPAPAEGPKVFKATKTEAGRALAPLAKAPLAGEVVHEGVVVTEADLDDSLRRWREAGDASRREWWKQWRILKNEIFAGEGWRLRQKEGKQAYTNFDQFCHYELGINADHAYRQMKAAAYLSEESLNQLGPSKASLITRFPEELWREIEKHALAGASTEHLRQRLKEENKKAGKGRGGKVTRRDGKERAQGGGIRKTKFSVEDFPAKQKVSLFIGPTGEGKKRADRIGDLPWGKRELVDGWVETFRLLKSEKGWYIEVTGERLVKE